MYLDADEPARIPRNTVSFRVIDADLEPDAITALLALTPDYTHRQGDYPRGNTAYTTYKQGMWSMHSTVPREASLVAHLESLLIVLMPKQAVISELSQQYTVDFYCGVFAQPGMSVPSRLLSQIASLGADFGVCWYFY
jgi:hypothetical protein